jgi:butyryl-CoA dehydrogenase
MLILTEEQKSRLTGVRQFVEEVISPRSAEVDRRQEFPLDLKEKMADQGLFRLIIPKSFGGMELNLTDLCLVIEEVSRVDASMGVTVQGHATALRPLILAASAELKGEMFPVVVKEKKAIGFAITESNAGSDSSGIQTSAILREGNYFLNGSKCFITSGGIADYYLVYAVTSIEKKHTGVSAFIVDGTSKGFSIGKKESKMGIRASPTTDLVFEDVMVPVSRLVGKEGEGFLILMKTLEASRPTIGAQALGIAEGALECAIQFARGAFQLGKPLIEQQGIQFMLAEMATQVEAARALLYQVTGMYDQHVQPIAAYSAMSKYFASDVAMRVTTDAVQVMGGRGYLRQYPAERMMRDAKVTQIYEGTNQIQRLVIARAILKSDYSSLYRMELRRA